MKALFTLLLSWLTFTVVLAQQDDGRIIRIPVIFHVVYANKAQNISTDSILAELKNLHNDFLCLNADVSKANTFFKEIIGNAKVDFYLKDSILQTNGEPGIKRLFARNNHRNLYRISPVINSRKYLNVYIGDIKYGGGYTDGVTPVPESAEPFEDDAVHLRYLWIGGHYRLLTHETGHWLGLWHVFEGGCSNDDDIADTTPQAGPTDGNCDICPPTNGLNGLACATGDGKARPSNYNNFMDYSGCRVMFTKMQAIRIRETIISFRPELWIASK